MCVRVSYKKQGTRGKVGNCQSPKPCHRQFTVAVSSSLLRHWSFCALYVTSALRPCTTAGILAVLDQLSNLGQATCPLQVSLFFIHQIEIKIVPSSWDCVVVSLCVKQDKVHSNPYATEQGNILKPLIHCLGRREYNIK